ncbi:hypothetical protein BASA83_006294 [Batrachochytrium salamandrivorans]|nr:hypothetical protein BASA81_014262 [Batrachochytrium salamandrivorans]KAH9271451.1 hypothetical protein BASA83_006294 [Batrachochytrium salamandrivorans]
MSAASSATRHRSIKAAVDAVSSVPSDTALTTTTALSRKSSVRQSNVSHPLSKSPIATAVGGASSFVIFRKLRLLVPECVSLSDMELTKVTSQTTPEIILAKQKILAFAFQSLGIDSVRHLLESRKQDKRQDIKSNINDVDRQMKEDIFRTIFTQLITQELGTLSCTLDISKESLLTSRSQYMSVLLFLVDTIQKNCTKKLVHPSQPSTKKAVSASELCDSGQEKHTAIAPKYISELASGGDSHMRLIKQKKSKSTPQLSSPGQNHLEISDTVMAIALQSNGKNVPGRKVKSEKLIIDPTDVRYFEQKNKLLSKQVCDLQKELDLVKEKHKRLEDEHALLKEVYDKATRETTQTDGQDDPTSILALLNRRRIMLLKSQNIQLLRQLDLYRKDTDTQEEFVYGVSETARQIQLFLKELSESQSFSKDASKKKQVVDCLRKLESIHKHSVRHSRDQLDPKEESRSLSFRFVSAFVSSKGLLSKKPKGVTIDDIASELVRFSKCITAIVEPNAATLIETHVREILQSVLSQTLTVAEGLFSLQVLVPAPPLPRLDKVLSDPNECPPSLRAIINCIPAGVNAKLKEPLELLEKSLFTEQKLHAIQLDALNKELEYHRGIYVKYNTMISSVIQKLDSRRKSIAKLLIDSVTPLQNLQTHLGSLELTRDAVVVFLEKFEAALVTVLGCIGELNAMDINDT